MNWLWALTVVFAGALMFVAVFAVVRWYIEHEPEETERLNHPDPLGRMLPGEKLSFEPLNLRLGEPVSEKLAQYLVARPPEYRVGPAERIVTIPKDVWAELQAMPNDGSWSTRQLVRAIQRANKKKGKA